ncbi:MAG: HAD-IIA family hydrolase [Candidatus Bipolaricaulia bacterium]
MEHNDRSRLGADYTIYIIDIDGVVLQGDRAIDGAPQAIARLRALGRRIVFLTNNATRSRHQHAKRLTAAGIPAATQEIINSAYVAAHYIRRAHGTAKVHVIGEAGLNEELEQAGHQIMTPETADFLIVGLDRQLNYEKLNRGLQAVLGGARFVATNTDATFPTETGLVPGAGCIVGAFRGMGFEPEIVVGKPSEEMMRAALAAVGVEDEDRGRCLMVGDRLETDIQGARNLGLDSALVLTGISKRAEIERAKIQPTYILESIAELPDL